MFTFLWRKPLHCNSAGDSKYETWVILFALLWNRLFTTTFAHLENSFQNYETSDCERILGFRLKIYIDVTFLLKKVPDS